MDEYISREALSDHVMGYGRPISCCVVTEQRGVRFEIGNWVCDGKIYFVVKADGKVGECMEISAKAPAADVAEVKHGWWLQNGMCSECLVIPETSHKNYCPNCGTKMDR